MKAMKMQSNVQANTMNAWEYDQEVKQARKASKCLRNIKRSRKQMWMNAE